MAGIIPRAWIPVLAILMIALIGMYAIVVQSFGFVAVLLIGLIGLATGMIIQHQLDQAIGDADAVQRQYANNVDEYSKNMINVYERAWYNILMQMNDMNSLFLNRTYSYYARYAESIAATVCNQNKTSINDDDMKPIIDEMAGIIKNYISRVFDSMYDLYKKAEILAGQRKNAGLYDGILYLNGWIVRSDGRIESDSAGTIGVLKNISLYINDIAIGYITADGQKYINETALKSVFLSSNIFNVKFRFNGNISYWDDEWTKYSYYDDSCYNGKCVYDLEIPAVIKTVMVSLKQIYISKDASGYVLLYNIDIREQHAVSAPAA